MNRDFVDRLNMAFNNERMSDVARRLSMPHATVRNYYKYGRLPAPEVLIKIANETGVSLSWLLIGVGDMYAGAVPPIGLGKFIEQKIGEMIDDRLAGLRQGAVVELGNVDVGRDFDVGAAVLEFDDPERVMSEWFRHEGRTYPRDYGVVFFRGWETFSPEDKVAAVHDAKRLLDRVLTSPAE